jgi:hypothetical protein
MMNLQPTTAAWVLVVVLLTIAYATAPSRSQDVPPGCAPRVILEQRIAKDYGESIVGAGVTPVGVLYVTANPTTQTFSVIVRRADGLACLIGGGKGWATTDPSVPGRPL